MPRLSKSNIVGIFTVVLASSIALHSYLTESPSSLILEKDGTLLRVSEKKADSTTGSLSFLQATPIGATGVEQQKDKKATILINKNETLMTIFTNLGFDRKHATHAISELKKVYNPRALKERQELSIEYTMGNGEKSAQLKSLNFKTTAGNSIELKYEKDQFIAQKFELKLIKALRKVEGNINSSFYSAALKQGVPASIVKEAISALSYDINWQHDPKSGDEFKILFEVFEDEDGNVIKTGDLKFAGFAPQGNWKRIYAFKTSSGSGFYNDKGESVIKSLLATPLDPTKMRITSRFGRRTHPILGYSKLHKGIDFGAPTGTPVSSAGDGVVLKAGWNGAYGNYVLVKHNNQYSTAYAHLSKINVKVGQKVRQRQNIGAVGATGRSTGPHLHYEVISNGQQVNPLSIKQLPAVRLNKKEMAQFQDIKTMCDKDLCEAVPMLQLVSAPTQVAVG
ncbi:M23 family metallopeptidase [Candidatus Odyssella acanthamoebae]|uniref:M23 family metallopeptidase n=1 Tax=Candidatus Odyssella acanthamoebae TaxID=91604 RepID=UPI00068C3162|nr:peptidoglycan DD-metalloendopeptidase family protein [Candidatus Paracaedibacter acanthamoebae]